MRVRIYSVMAGDLRSNSDLIGQIRRLGKILPGTWTERNPYDVTGMTFLLGGRNSIASVLRSVPSGSIKGNKLLVRYGTESTLGKRYTIISITSVYNPHHVVKNKQKWPRLLRDNHYSNITFASIADKIWSDENKVVDVLMDYAVGKAADPR